MRKAAGAKAGGWAGSGGAALATGEFGESHWFCLEGRDIGTMSALVYNEHSVGQQIEDDRSQGTMERGEDGNEHEP